MTAIVKVSDEQMKTLQAWRAIALEKMPYMTSTLFSLRVVNAPGLGTFAVDAGLRLYIDFEAVAPKGVSWCAEALLHEASHVLQRHDLLAAELGAANDRSLAHTINIAADCAINDDLVAAGCLSMEADGITPHKIGAEDFQTPHHYYKIIRDKQAQQQPKPKPQPGQGQPDDQQGQSSAGNAAGSGSGDDGPYKGCGSGAGGNAAPCELDPDDDFGGQAPAATETEKERNAIATASAIREAHAQGIGNVPAGLVEWAELALTPSKTPWQQVLASHIRRSVASKMGAFDQDSTRRNRRRHRVEVKDGTGYVVGNLVVPGTYTPVPTLAVIRDTSGSMGAEDLAIVSAEVEGIAKKMGVRGRELTITDVDAKAYATRAYKGVKTMETVEGRGGTNMSVGIIALSQARPRPTAIIVITDGETPWPPMSLGVPVIAACIDRSGYSAEGSDCAPPAWIKTVYIDIEDAK